MFYLIRYYPYLFFLLSSLPLLYGILRIARKRSWALVKSAASRYRICRDKRVLSILILLALLLNCFMVPLKLRQTASAEISLNYPEASQGLNPNGTRYNQAGILSAAVLERAVEKGALKGITARDLGRVLGVSPKVQGGSYEESSYFISTQFVIAYYANEKTAHLNGETLLSLVAEAYKEQFLHAYSDNVSALKLDFTGIRKEDYLDICEYLKDKTRLISDYMTGLAGKGPAFQSPSNGETFQSIAARAENISKVMVEKLEAYVLENSVSKETASYMARLSFQNVFRYFDAQKANHASRNNLTAISMYEDDMARIVLVPTYDTNYQFYMSQTRIGIDDFAKEAETQANDKTKINSQIAHNNHVLQQLSARPMTGGPDEKAELLTAQVEEELEKLAGEARVLVEEYSASQANQYISITVHTWESAAASTAVKILLYTLLFAAALHCAAFAASLDRENGGERKR
ncbi:MAG: hypothetical protein HFG26_03655 [Provencibacterium sp.]|jgi:hypothetical protein|nr:hypothetical protein [Provencibacterium sp.]